MSEWIESHTTLPRHRKTRRLGSLLGVPLPLAIGYLHMLWYYTLEFAPGGDLSEHSHGDIAEACEWPGDGDDFVAALITAGWLSTGDGLQVHDWFDYNSSHKRRKVDAERQRSRRLKQRDSEDMSRVVTVTGTPCHKMSRPTGQDRTGQDKEEESPVDNLPVDNLVNLCITELPPSESTEAEYKRTVDRYRAKMRDEHIERIIIDLAKYRPKKPYGPKLHLVLAAWLAKEPRDALPPAHAEFKPAPDLTPAEREAAKLAAKQAVERVQAMTGKTIGRAI